MRPVVVRRCSAAGRRKTVRAILDHIAAANAAAVVVGGATAAADVQAGGLYVTVATQLDLRIVHRRATTAGVPTEISAPQPTITTDVFVAVVGFAVAAARAVAVGSWPENIEVSLVGLSRTADVGCEVVLLPSSAAGRGFAVTQQLETTATDFVSAIVNVPVAAFRVDTVRLRKCAQVWRTGLSRR